MSENLDALQRRFQTSIGSTYPCHLACFDKSVKIACNSAFSASVRLGSLISTICPDGASCTALVAFCRARSWVSMNFI